MGKRLEFLSQVTRIGMYVILTICSVKMIMAKGTNSEDVPTTVDVSGTVTDSNGETLIGVTVLEIGTNNGAITDISGKYSLTVSSSESVLSFSFTGFATQKITVGSLSIIDVKLSEDTELLDEVIVVGYGAQKKSDITGAVVRADLETFKDQGNTSIAQSLQGTIPGLNVGISTDAGENVNLSIRGNITLSTDPEDSQPLIVVDGIIFRGSFQDINPDDVKSVDVLKDVSSTAIYGSLGANGVIMVTTKSGKATEKPIFNYSARYSFKEDANRLTYNTPEQYLDQIRAFDWEQSYEEGRFYDPNYDVTLGLEAEGEFIYSERWGYENGVNVDWQDLMTRQGFVNNHNLSISGSTKNVNYYVSGSFIDNEEILKGDNFKRITGRVNLDLKLNDWLTIGTNSFVTTSDYSGVEFDRRHYTTSWFVTPTDEDGNLLDLILGGRQNELIRANDLNDDNRLQLNSTLYAVVMVPHVEGLQYRVNYNNSYRNRLQNQFMYVTENPETIVGQASKDAYLWKDWTLDHIISYKRTINELHNIDATLVYGREERYLEQTRILATNFPNTLTDFNNLSLAENAFINSDAQDESSLYQMARVNYNYKGKYFLTGTLRRDGFSGFGANEKSALFPTAAIGWAIIDESFLSSLKDVVNELKLRVSYGQSGRRSSLEFPGTGRPSTDGRYLTLASVQQLPAYVYGDGGSTVIGQQPLTPAFPNLKWETTTGLNVGLDYGFIDNRIYGNMEFYQSTTSDIIAIIPVPSLSGFERSAANIGEVKNAGLELSITTINVRTNNFEWSSTINFSTNRNEVVKVLGFDADGDGKEDDLIETSLGEIAGRNYGFFIGEQLGTIFHYQIDPNDPIYDVGDEDFLPGFQPGDYRLVDQDGDGLITSEADKVVLGHQNPVYRWSLLNKFSYKNFSLSVFLNSIQGGRNGYRSYDNWWSIPFWNGATGSRTSGLLPQVAEYWTPDNPNSEGPRINYDSNGNVIPHFLRDRSFVRLQDVTLSYTFDKSLLNKIGINSLSVMVSGRNLYSWRKDWPGVDPEPGAGIGISYGRPVTRSFTMGLNMSF
ncbi:MAG: SusC/RagA family TonB-linked outer membrane protein [Bacteroidota bacterium]